MKRYNINKYRIKKKNIQTHRVMNKENEENEENEYMKKQVKNLDNFNSNNSLKPIKNKFGLNKILTLKNDIKKINLKSENFTPFFIDMFKKISDEIIFLKNKKINIIKNNNFINIIKYFNRNNNLIFNQFKEINITIDEFKKSNLLDLNKCISYSEKLNNNIIIQNKISYLNKCFEINNNNLNKLLNLKLTKQNIKIPKLDNKSIVNNKNKDKINISISLNSSSISDLEFNLNDIKTYNNIFELKCQTIAELKSDKNILIPNKNTTKNEIILIDEDIINITKVNKNIKSNLEFFKKNLYENNNKIKKLNIDIQYSNNFLFNINKFENKFNKILINFIKEEIEYGYDLKSNGIMWLYIKLIKLKDYNIDYTCMIY